VSKKVVYSVRSDDGAGTTVVYEKKRFEMGFQACPKNCQSTAPT